MLELPDYARNRQIMSKIDIDFVFFTLSTPDIREIYDKTGMVFTESDYLARNKIIPQHMKYMQAF